LIINVEKLTKPQVIAFDRESDWIEPILKSLIDQEIIMSENAQMNGQLQIDPIEFDATTVKVDLQISFVLQCGRCLENLQWRETIAKEFRFQRGHDPLLDRSEVNLTESEIEKDYLDATGELNLADLLAELLLLEVPSTPRHDLENDKCSATSSGNDEGPLYKTENADDAHPFAVLGKLKN